MLRCRNAAASCLQMHEARARWSASRRRLGGKVADEDAGIVSDAMAARRMLLLRCGCRGEGIVAVCLYGRCWRRAREAQTTESSGARRRRYLREREAMHSDAM